MQVEFDYTRSLGPVLSEFMAGLADRRILGARLADGRVAVPPPEFDPTTFQRLSDLVEVASVGEVVSWSWVAEPLPDQPLGRPFAFALVRLDGADTPMLHAVDAGSPEQMSTGMRVQATWADEPQGRITDISCFQPVGDAGAGRAGGGAGHSAGVVATEDTSRSGRITVTPVRLSYDYAASPEESVFGRGLKEGRILAQACPKCHKVYVPPRGACPVDGVPTSEPVELPDTGIVTTFCVVNVPFLGQQIKPPYVSAYVLLDGADIAFLHLILGCDASEVRMGMRVKAVWKPEEERTFSLQNISHFEPTGEPDADYESYRRHL